MPQSPPGKKDSPDRLGTPAAAPATALQGAAKIVLFFLLLMAAAGALHFAINRGLRSISTSKFGAFNAMMSGKADSEIVINGSSRALSHYDPAIIRQVTGHSAYNIGMNASQIDFQAAVLATYLKHNVKPMLVIQNLDVFSLETTAHGDIYDPGLYIPFLYEDDLYQPLLQIDPVVWKWKHIPLYGYAVDDMRFTWLSGLLADLGYSPQEDYFRGFNPRDGAWNDDFIKFRSDHPNGIVYKIEPRGIQSLIRIIEMCQKSEIKIALVYSPEFVEMQSLEADRAQVFQQFSDIAKKYGIPFIDFSSSPICGRKDLFQNSQHLNSYGASIFTTALAHQLLSQHILESADAPR